MEDSASETWEPGWSESDPTGFDPAEAMATWLTQLALPTTGSVYVPGSLDWQDQANCKGQTHLFFSPIDDFDNPKREEGRRQRIAAAKALCEACEVREDCLQWAVESRLTHGIAGGLTATERRRIKEQWRKDNNDE